MGTGAENLDVIRNGGEMSVLLPEINRDDLEFLNTLSTGAYGSVYRAKWISRNLVVAVKRVFVLEKEAKILSMLRHKNIIHFYGVCTVSPDFGIVTEFAENGSLYDMLAKVETLDFETLIDWAIDIAEGVNYLHSQTEELILHRDLKSKNVVINKDWVCKLCDFGTSKVERQAQTTRMTYAGTVPWMSPEMISQTARIDEGTDIWSYAVILWELLTREVPFKGLSEYRIATMIVDEGIRLTVPQQCPQTLARLLSDCWQQVASDRPRAPEIVKRLQSMQNDQLLSEETDRFIEEKSKWKCEIDQQLEQLQVKEMELSDREQQLVKREQMISEREQSLLRTAQQHRALSLTQSGRSWVDHWDEDGVCAYLTSLNLQVPQQTLAWLHRMIRQHRISGPRLLLLTDQDLINMGLVTVGFRTQIRMAISKLASQAHRLRNFPSLADSQMQLQALEDIRRRPPTSQTTSILLQVNLIARRVSGPGAQTAYDKHRWRLQLDADWLVPISSAHIQLQYGLFTAAGVVNTVTFCGMSGLEPITVENGQMSMCDWMDWPDQNQPLDEEEEEGNERAAFYLGSDIKQVSTNRRKRSVVVIVTYRDFVMQPTNTRLQFEITTFERTHTVIEREIEITLRPKSLNMQFKKRSANNAMNGNALHLLTQQSISDLQSMNINHNQSILHNQSMASISHNGLHHSDTFPRLSGVWQQQRHLQGQGTVDPLTNHSTELHRSPSRVWADIAKGLRSPVSQPATPDRPRKASVPTPSPQPASANAFRLNAPFRAMSSEPETAAVKRGFLSVSSSDDSSKSNLPTPTTSGVDSPRFCGKRCASETRSLDLSPAIDALNTCTSNQYSNQSPINDTQSDNQPINNLSPVDEHGPSLPANQPTTQTAKSRRQRIRRNNSQGTTVLSVGISNRVYGGYEKWKWKG